MCAVSEMILLHTGSELCSEKLVKPIGSRALSSPGLAHQQAVVSV